MDDTFRNRMSALLREKKMTQRELATRLGVSEVTVSRWMTVGEGSRNPSVKTLQKIAEILETTPDYLLGRTDERTQKESGTSDGVNLGAILAGTALTATAVIGIVALAKAMGKLDEKDSEQIKDILNK